MSNRVAPPQQDITQWVWHSLMALFSIGFIAWAAAVWHATTLVEKLDERLIATTARIDQMQQDIHRLEDRLNGK